jgi:hypothetical protein
VRTVATWRVPLLSDAHVSLFFDIHATGTVNGGTVRFVSGAASLSIAVAAGGPTRYTGTLTMPVGAVYDDVSLVMFATDGASSVQLDRVSAEFTPLASPLAAGRVALATGSDLDPMGSLVVPTDAALSAFIASKARDNLEALQRRPRALLIWSGIDLPGASAGIDHAPHQHRVTSIVRPGAFQAGVFYTAWVRVQQSGAGPTRVIVSAARSPREWPTGGGASSQVAVIDVAVGAANLWQSATFTLPEGRGLAGLEHPGCVLGVALNPEVGAAVTTASLYAVSVWGE